MPELGGTFGDGAVVIDSQKLADFMRSTDGPIYRRLIEDGERVKQRARELVGVYRPPDAYSASHRRRRPGTLRDSIVKRVVTDPQSGFAVLVGSEDPIALWHHEGTQPHPISPRAGGRLVFFSRRAGKVVYLRKDQSVNHPGTRPNRFLTRALDVLR